MTVCPDCGAVSARNARHCIKCGARLNVTGVLAAAGASSAAAHVVGGSASTGGAGEASLVGTMLSGRYRVVRVLGAGSFGRVYLAKDMQEAGSPLLAIKELLDARFVSPEDRSEAIAWFRREVSALLTLEHPGIPAIYGYWTEHANSGPFYLAMEYVPGKTLEQMLRDAGGRVPWPQAVTWGIALCDVLSYLHSRVPPFVFRDLKLSNVILDDRTNRPVLIDFGITRQLTAASGTAIGTWGYVPYEQVEGRAEPRSDIYALGATLHALITGRQPDAEYTRLIRTGLGVKDALRGLFPPVDRLAPDAPVILSQVIARATAFAPADRYPNAGAMSAALQHVLAITPTRSAYYIPHSYLPAAAATGAPQRGGGAARGAALALIALVALVAGALVGGLGGVAITQQAFGTPAPGLAAQGPYAAVLGAKTSRTHASSGPLLSAAMWSKQANVSQLIAIADPSVLALDKGAFPSGATITHRHLDRTAAAVNAEHLFGDPNRQGERLQQLHFAGSLYESVRLPRFHGAARDLALLATIFPSTRAARAAMNRDSSIRGCRSSPPVMLPMRTRTCAFRTTAGPISGMYVVATAANVEFVVAGDVLAASPAALKRIVADASTLARHEAAHVAHVLSIAHGCLKRRQPGVSCSVPGAIAPMRPTDQPVVKAAPASAHLSNVRIVLLDGQGKKRVSTIVAGHAARIRLYWTISHLSGSPRETVTWRITRSGHTFFADHATDRAVGGTSYAEDVITVDNSWAGGPRYTVTGTVSVAGTTARVHITFAVVKK